LGPPEGLVLDGREHGGRPSPQLSTKPGQVQMRFEPVASRRALRQPVPALLEFELVAEDLRAATAVGMSWPLLWRSIIAG
jgi:hypothetical protein